MSYESFSALLALAFATLFTPGPNNAMLANSGANFGFRRTLPHLVGVAAGFPLLVLIVGMLLGGLFQQSALLRDALRWLGAAILLYLAWRIAFGAGKAEGARALQPFTLWQAAAFQWVNPKGWSMAIAATSQFIAGERPFRAALIVAVTFMIVGFASAATWVLAGQALNRWLTTDLRRRLFGFAMATLIVLSVIQLVTL